MTDRSAQVDPWRLPLGANLVDGGVEFSVWAPRATRVEVEIQDLGGAIRYVPLHPRSDGVHSTADVSLTGTARYRFRLDGGASYPDPWSRFQPDGVHGSSLVVDPAYDWTDDGWLGLDRDRLALYELHVGTFSAAGTFDGVVDRLPYLRRLGITAIELMPVAEFPGSRNWGYDGVDLFAPTRNYGGVAGLKRLVDAAHRHGLGVILDVVYNHLGPDGNYLRAFSDTYFTDRHVTPWGPALNFDGPGSLQVREFVIHNACYWLNEYHLDGLRLDATHAVVDDSPYHVLAELTARARGSVGRARRVHIIAEDDRRDISFTRPLARGGYGLDGVWADDFHHSVHVLLTGERDGYYGAYAGTPTEVAKTIEGGFLYQGQMSPYHGARRGQPVLDDPASAFVFCIQNHDQIGNRAFGDRLNQLAGTRRYAVAVVLLLLCPEIPLLFMGQEFAASTPFLYFTDHEPDLGTLVSRGRREEFARFAAFQDPDARERIPDPQDEQTYRRSRLQWDDSVTNSGVLRLHRDLLRMRQLDPVFDHPNRQQTRAAAVSNRCVVIRRWERDEQRLIVANFGDDPVDVPPNVASGSLPVGGRWRTRLSTEWRRYGGNGGRRQRQHHDGHLVVSPGTAVVFSLDTSP